jgi:diaminohydroxyphosphoribosylaminopyrimidine deaminase/5-amino-6-(5-phosphoribosylamino)uracil reductase
MNRPMTTSARGAATTVPDVDPETDRRFMAAAITHARRNAGRAWPNPSVGAVVVRTDRGFPEVVGRGVTAAGGRPHAEVLALRAAGEQARGATVYVTLEPCAHHGKTPPCADALVAGGVARVVTAVEDPDPRVAGGGHAILRRAGIAVTTGVLATEARRLHAGHILRVREGRPVVSLKMAVSADGFIGRTGAGQVPISGPVAKAYALALRSECDAIMVGIGTILEDDPQLTCRLPGLEGRSPVRVVLDAMARTPPTATVVTSSDVVPTWIVTAPDAPADRVAALVGAGVRVIVAERERGGALDPRDVLFQLGSEGITSLVTEGGARVARSLIEADLVDEIHLVTTDAVIGPGGVPAFAGLPVETVLGSPTFVVAGTRRLGDDRLVHLWRRTLP